MKKIRKKSGPPACMLRFLKWFCKPEYHADIEGDLFELYERREVTNGRLSANFQLFKDILFLFRPGIVRPAVTILPITNNAMIKSYFKMGWRSILKSKMYAALNVVGLTFGIVCFLLIGLYVYDELTFDHHHANADRIYRIVTHEKNPNNQATTVAAAGFMLAEEARHSFPEVEMTTRMQRVGRANLVDPENPVNIQETVTIADEYFLQVFDFPFIEGDRRTALKDPNSIVITQDLAMRIFNTLDVVNKYLQFNYMDTPLKITGVLQNHPQNSSFSFTSLMSEATWLSDEESKREAESDWASTSFTVYALLREEADHDSVSRKMTRLVHANASIEPGTVLSFTLQPLKDVHLHSAGIVDGARNSNVDSIPQGNPVYVTIFSFTAIFVLLIAGINYTNLTTARASSRIKEIGVRKAVGAVRGNIVGQFLVESLLTTIIAFFLAVIVANLLLGPFSNFLKRDFSFFTASSLRFWGVAVSMVVLVAILSGGYAALLMSRFNPVALLKGLNVRSGNDFMVRKVLVMFQFTISTVMIIGTMVLVMQVRYLNNSDLGFNKDLMLVIDVNVVSARSNFEWVKNEMLKIPSVQHVSVTSRVPGEWKTFRRVKIEKEGSAGEPVEAFVIGADKDFLATYQIPLVEGRNFLHGHDSTAILINETAARMLNKKDVYNQVVEIPQIARENFFVPLFDDVNISFKPRVIGIVKDFHFQSLRDKIQPLVIAYHHNPLQVIDYYSVKISSSNVQETLDQLKAVMVANDELEPFEYHFLDDQLALFYLDDKRSQTILTWVAAASVFIACLGLFGLATYSAEQRLKEIGIRKVLGADIKGLIGLLSKDFLKLVLIACFISFPIAWWGADQWLSSYAYHVRLEPWIFVLAGLMATGIALLTVSYQAVKAAVVNPVTMLKSE